MCHIVTSVCTESVVYRNVVVGICNICRLIEHIYQPLSLSLCVIKPTLNRTFVCISSVDAAAYLEISCLISAGIIRPYLAPKIDLEGGM